LSNLGRNISSLSQHVSDLPEKKEVLPEAEPTLARVRKVCAHVSSISLVTFFVLIGLSLLLFSGQIISSLFQVNPVHVAQKVLVRQPQTRASEQRGIGYTPTPAPTAQPAPASPFFMPNNATVQALQLPGGHYILYQTATHIILVSTTDNSTQPVYTPGYNYNQAIYPILTPDGQLLYSGNQGIWLTDIFDAQPVQLAQFDANTTLTSLALSKDGKTIAWSTEPVDGNGQTDIYAGPLANPQLILQQSSLDCPCFRVFSFLNSTGTHANSTLLLTDDRGSNEAVQYGLWTLDITNPLADPQLVMDEGPQQGPLTLLPYSNTLLYSTYEGAVPVPTDNSVPADVAALPYANSLNITTMSSSPVLLGNAQVILPEQHNLSNSAQYHWVTTPIFSPDGHTLAYVEFSSDSQPPYDRHSALYTVKISGSGNQLQASRPELVATSITYLLELGPWLNSHVVTMYGDGAIYALDVQSGSLTALVQPGSYLRILGITGNGQ
jgi:hypothetical protein